MMEMNSARFDLQRDIIQGADFLSAQMINLVDVANFDQAPWHGPNFKTGSQSTVRFTVLVAPLVPPDFATARAALVAPGGLSVATAGGGGLNSPAFAGSVHMRVTLALLIKHADRAPPKRSHAESG